MPYDVSFKSHRHGPYTKFPISLPWVKLGIRLERIEPGQPQQNGRHERMHATLKAETARPPADSAAEQQARFDAFRRDFNENRPHQALGQIPPIRRYHPSPRPFPDKIGEPWYDPDHATRRVRPTGEIKWGGDLVFVSEALAGETVGVAETRDGDWVVRFAAVDLGLIDRTSKKLRRFAAARPSPHRAIRTNQEDCRPCAAARSMECAPWGGQDQAADLTVCRAW